MEHANTAPDSSGEALPLVLETVVASARETQEKLVRNRLPDLAECLGHSIVFFGVVNPNPTALQLVNGLYKPMAETWQDGRPPS